MSIDNIYWMKLENFPLGIIVLQIVYLFSTGYKGKRKNGDKNVDC